MLKADTKFADMAVAVPPGISWTAPLKGRPWMNPPKTVSVTDLAQQYIAAIGDEASMNDVLDALETKIPLAVIAETLMLGGVSKGQHTLDAGLLVVPVIIEVLKTVAELNDIEYLVFADDEVKANTVSPRVLKQVIGEMTAKVAEPVVEEPVMEEEQTGLMARKKAGV